jgi:hypothetical protein
LRTSFVKEVGEKMGGGFLQTETGAEEDGGGAGEVLAQRVGG